MQEMRRVIDGIDPNAEYTDDISISIFNTLMNY